MTPAIAESRNQHRAAHDHPRHQRCGEKSKQNDEQPADQRHDAKSIGNTSTNLSTVMPGLVPGIHVLVLQQSKTWMAGTSPAMTNFTLSVLIRHRHGAQRLALAHRQFLGLRLQLAAGGKNVAAA